jgi:hypothetical protein
MSRETQMICLHVFAFAINICAALLFPNELSPLNWFGAGLALATASTVIYISRVNRSNDQLLQINEALRQIISTKQWDYCQRLIEHDVNDLTIDGWDTDRPSIH